MAVGRQLHPVPPDNEGGSGRLARAARSFGARARHLVVAWPRWVPPCHRGHARGGRRLSRRTHRGSPMSTRRATRSRSTKETSIELALDVDGAGRAEVSTGLPFFDHMLDQIARHGGFDLTLR